MRFRLRYLQHDLELTEGEFVVGRNASCQLSLDDPLVSRRHALLRVAPAGVTVEDLQSRNGVLVNGQRIDGSASLAPGDRLLIGSQEMTLFTVEDHPARGRLNLTLPKITSSGLAVPPPGSLAWDATPHPGPLPAAEGTHPTPAVNPLTRIHSSTTEPGKGGSGPHVPPRSGDVPLDRPSSTGLHSAGRVGSTPGTPLRSVAFGPTPLPRPESSPGSQPRAPGSGAGSTGSHSRHPPPLGMTEPEYEQTMIRRADAFTLLAGVAEKALAMGRAVEAERILASPLGDVIEASRAGKKVIPSLVDQAARFSAKLATATGKGAWADYVIELYSAQKRPCPAPVIDELYNALRRVTAVDLQRLREYIEELRSRLSTFGPAERFLLQRLEGLERLAALR